MNQEGSQDDMMHLEVYDKGVKREYDPLVIWSHGCIFEGGIISFSHTRGGTARYAF